jgi:hypothetical protein
VMGDIEKIANNYQDKSYHDNHDYHDNF